MTAGLKLGRTFLVTLAVALLLPDAAAEARPPVTIVGGTAEEVEFAPDDSVVHRASQFRFANHIGDMPLRKVAIYGQADVSVDYTLRGGGNGDPWITLFVYPATKDLTAEAADIEAALTDKLKPLRISAPAPLPPTARDGNGGWFRGRIGDMQLISTYVVVRRGDWFIEARASIPDAAGQPGLERTLKALAGIQWDWTPSPSAAPPRT